jgi:hypothetical protein
MQGISQLAEDSMPWSQLVSDFVFLLELQQLSLDHLKI